MVKLGLTMPYKGPHLRNGAVGMGRTDELFVRKKDPGLAARLGALRERRRRCLCTVPAQGWQGTCATGLARMLLFLHDTTAPIPM